MVMMRPLTVLFLFFLTSSVFSLKYRYKTYYYKQQVDHFGFTNVDKFPQRYLSVMKTGTKMEVQYFSIVGTKEIFHYLLRILDSYGKLLQNIQQWLYLQNIDTMANLYQYGKLSFLNTTYSGYLTSEQALADYADLINHIKNNC
ncbi:UNVERIFIED_CONTAM: hypothetical protein RMT77_010960 [Armadillidium vulgare]